MSLPGLIRDVPLRTLTTLGVGGPAAYLVAPARSEDLADALRWAREQGHPVLPLGDGSNMLVSERGFPGLVLRLPEAKLHAESVRAGTVRVHASGGTSWDALVRWAVERDLAGIECLSGIPGRVGAAPVQNIGAYGQELSTVLDAVHVMPSQGGSPVRLSGAECGFGYRSSRFKGEWRGRFIVTGVELLLRPGGAPTLRYGALRQELDSVRPGLSEVRSTVLRVRRSKSMVLDAKDPNHRSAGSFFMNPIVPEEQVERVRELVGRAGLDPASMPTYPADSGVKLSAAWLIERAGFARGYGDGAAGLSTRHTLALINRGTATADDLIALAKEVRGGVLESFGVLLWPETVFLGFEQTVAELLS